MYADVDALAVRMSEKLLLMNQKLGGYISCHSLSLHKFLQLSPVVCCKCCSRWHPGL